MPEGIKVRLVDGHAYPDAEEGAIGILTSWPSVTSSNVMVDWGNGPVRCHLSRLEKTADA